jgi:hypothetical protein
VLGSLTVVDAAVTTDSLVGYWKFDNSTSDASGDGRVATLVGSPSYSTTVAGTSYTNSHSLLLNGTSQYATVENATSLNLTSALTMSAWIYPTSLAGGAHDVILAKKGEVDCCDGVNYEMALSNTAGELEWYYHRDGGPAGQLLSSGWAPAANTWNFVSITVNGTTIKFYGGTLGNVSLRSTQTLPEALTNYTTVGGKLYIGVYEADGAFAHYFGGNLDDIRIYSRALSGREITELAAGNHTSQYWTGTSNTGYEGPGNWSGSFLPDPYTRVVIPWAGSQPVTMTGAVQLAGLTIGTGAALKTNTKNLTVNDSGTFTNYGTMQVHGSETFTSFTNDTTKGTVLLYGTGSYTGLPTGANYYHLNLNDGLAAYWKLDETSGVRAADSSGYGHSGALLSGPTISSTVAPTLFANARSVSFDGTNDYIRTSTLSSSIRQHRAGTVSLWLRGSAADDTPISVGTQGSTTNIFWLKFTNSSTLQFLMRTSGSDNYRGTFAFPSDGAWHHVLVTGGANGNKAYVDGVAKTITYTSGSATQTQWFDDFSANPEHLVLGTDATPADYYAGQIDDVRIYSRQLEVGEIAALAVGNQPSLKQATVTLSAALDVNAVLTLNGGTLDVSSSNYGVTVGGSLLNNGGVINPRKGTFTLDGTSSALQILSGGQRFNAVTFNGSSATWTLQDRLTVSGALTLNNGTLDAHSTGNYSVRAGTVTQTSGAFTARSGILALTSPVNQTATITSTLNALHVEDPTENGLVGYWKFDEGTNSGAILDASGTGNAGVRKGTGALVWTGSTLPSLAFENPFAMDFNGVSDYVLIPHHSSIALSNNFSISTWIRPETFRPYAGIASKYHTVGSAGFTFRLNGSSPYNKISFAGISELESNSSLTANTWYHVVVVCDSGLGKIYINGSLDTSGSLSMSSTTNDLAIGVDYLTSPRYFNGQIDDMRIYNRVLSAAEVRSLYNGSYADGDNSTATITLGGNLDLSTMTILSGVVGGSSRTIDVSGDWNNYVGTGAYVAGTSTVDLDGSSTQNIRGSTNFSTLEISTSSAQTVKFGSGTTQGVSTLLTLTGQSGNILTLAPLVAAVPWYLDVEPSATQSISYVSPSYSNASPGAQIDADNGTNTDGGNNVNWDFTVEATAAADGHGRNATDRLREAQSGGGGSTGNLSAASGSSLTATLFVPDYAPLAARLLQSQKQAQRASLLPPPDRRKAEAVRSMLVAKFRDRLAAPSSRVFASEEEKEHAAADSEERRIDRAAALARQGSTLRGASTGVPVDPQVGEKRGFLMLVLSSETVVYRDVPVEEWFAPYVSTLVEDGVAQGYKDAKGNLTGEFGVGKSVTIAEVLKMAMETAGMDLRKPLPPPRNASARGSWASAYVAVAEDEELTLFTADLDVHRPATRGEVLQILLEVLDVPIGDKILDDYTDLPASHPHARVLSTATWYGLIEGDTDLSGRSLGTVRPDAPINRAEVSKIIALARALMD